VYSGLEKKIILAAKDHTINTAYVSQAIYCTYDGIVIVNDPQNTTYKKIRMRKTNPSKSRG